MAALHWVGLFFNWQNDHWHCGLFLKALYTLFDEIKEDSAIYHRWLFHDKPVAKFKLFLKAPRWATYSSIQLREADKGPWRVEIRDSNNKLLKTIRFSIVN